MRLLSAVDHVRRIVSPAPTPLRRLSLAALVIALAVVGYVFIRQAWHEPRGPHRGPALVGINLAGGEFAPDNPDAAYGRDYIYPDAKVAEPFLSRGMTAVRLPVRWERIQPWPLAMLSPNETKRLDAAVEALSGFRLIVIDLHNFAAFHGTRLAGDARSAALLADVWRRLAERYKDNPAIAFGLMNEPVEIAPRDWRGLADAATAAIRSTGAGNLILVPGANWTGVYSWGSGGDASNAAAMADFADSNFAFELHQYLDDGAGGQSADCVEPAELRALLGRVTTWLRDRHARGFLAEFGAGPSARCLAGLQAMLGHMNDNGDTWLGWTYWAAGPWWGDHWMAVQPRPGRPLPPQLETIARYTPSAAPDPTR